MLNCVATCRGTDKKPCDNILEEPTITQHVNKSFSDILGGNSITDKLVKQHDTFNSIGGAATLSSRFADAAIGCSALASIGSPIAKFAGSAAAKVAGTHVTSAFMVEPIGKGEFFAPLSGNWHRKTGLTQRKSVFAERTTLSQANLVTQYQIGRCKA